jgi:hypothetical protein
MANYTFPPWACEPKVIARTTQGLTISKIGQFRAQMQDSRGMNLRDAWLQLIQHEGDLLQGQFFIVGEVQDQALAFRQITDSIRKSFLQVGTLKAKPCASFRPAPKVDDVFFSRSFSALGMLGADFDAL